jgi:hypothetical protein
LLAEGLKLFFSAIEAHSFGLIGLGLLGLGAMKRRRLRLRR